MEIKYEVSGKVLFLYFKGELDEHYAKGVKEYVDNLISKQEGITKVVFNFSDLSFMDSTGIGVLLGRYKLLKRLGITSAIESPQVNVEKVLELSGIYEVMARC